MSLELSFVPLALTVIVLILAVTAWLERSVLSPRSLILYSARSRRTRPEQVERLVAMHAERIMRERNLNR